MGNYQTHPPNLMSINPFNSPPNMMNFPPQNFMGAPPPQMMNMGPTPFGQPPFMPPVPFGSPPPGINPLPPLPPNAGFPSPGPSGSQPGSEPQPPLPPSPGSEAPPLPPGVEPPPPPGEEPPLPPPPEDEPPLPPMPDTEVVTEETVDSSFIPPPPPDDNDSEEMDLDSNDSDKGEIVIESAVPLDIPLPDSEPGPFNSPLKFQMTKTSEDIMESENKNENTEHSNEVHGEEVESEHKKVYKFAWDEDDKGNESDITVSSVHTSDISEYSSDLDEEEDVKDTADEKDVEKKEEEDSAPEGIYLLCNYYLDRLYV